MRRHFPRSGEAAEDLHELSELEILERGLTGWSRFDGVSEERYFRFNDLPTFDRGQLVERFIEYRKNHPKR